MEAAAGPDLEAELKHWPAARQELQWQADEPDEPVWARLMESRFAARSPEALQLSTAAQVLAQVAWQSSGEQRVSLPAAASVSQPAQQVVKTQPVFL